MVLDTSAATAVILGEPDATFYARAILEARQVQMSAVSALEVALVIGGRKGDNGRAEVAHFMATSRVYVVPFDAEQLRLAREAWWTYGKGRHRARLNLGDCCSYALAKLTGEPLLYKGDDFARTDLTCIASPRLS
jgi:ribonuclease VapC